MPRLATRDTAPRDTAPRDAAAGAPTGVITVADLLSRYGPASVDPGPDLEPDTVPVSVQSLLRREGHVPAGSSAAPAAGFAEEFEVTEYRDDEPRHRSGALVKRGAIAAGVLLAAGSVFGAAVVTTGSPAPASDDRVLDETPARAWLDQQTPAAAPIPDIGPSAATGVLDAGDGVDQGWMNAAFPSSTTATPDRTAQRGTPATTERSTAPATSATPTPAAAAPSTAGSDDGSGNGGGDSADDRQSTGGGSPSGSDSSDDGDAQDGGDGGGNGNGGSNAPQQDDGDRPGLVGGVVDGLVDTVAGLL